MVAQLAISLALVAAAALAGRSFVRLAQLEPGFDPQNVFTARIQLGDRYADVKTRAGFFGPLLDRLETLPGVESAGVVLLRPLSGPIGCEWPFTLEGQDARDHASNPLGNFEAVSAGYFGTMRIPFVEGRNFTSGDVSDAPQVAIVSESLARRYWPGRSAIGRRIKAGPPDSLNPWKTIVGVVGDVRYREWTSVRLDVYVPYQQWSFAPWTWCCGRPASRVASPAPCARRCPRSIATCPSRRRRRSRRPSPTPLRAHDWWPCCSPCFQ